MASLELSDREAFFVARTSPMKSPQSASLKTVVESVPAANGSSVFRVARRNGRTARDRIISPRRVLGDTEPNRIGVPRQVNLLHYLPTHWIWGLVISKGGCEVARKY
jgi:hypothetical protein